MITTDRHTPDGWGCSCKSCKRTVFLSVKLQCFFCQPSWTSSSVLLALSTVYYHRPYTYLEVLPCVRSCLHARNTRSTPDARSCQKISVLSDTQNCNKSSISQKVDWAKPVKSRRRSDDDDKKRVYWIILVAYVSMLRFRLTRTNPTSVIIHSKGKWLLHNVP